VLKDIFSSQGTISVSEITDYNQGNSGNGTYSGNEGDTIDLSNLLFHTSSGHAIASLVRVVADQSGSFSALQIDPSGGTSQSDWETIAKLDNIHTGNSVSIILDLSHTVTVVGVSNPHTV
jgi:hypothetical protein